ncbi:MAG: sporulation protein YabP [Syntrophaceticus sp.]
MPQLNQELTLTNREVLQTTGVQKVVSFDDHEIILETGIGLLVLHGEELHITHLDLTAGDLIVEGLIISLEFCEERGKKIKAKGKNILERLIK